MSRKQLVIRIDLRSLIQRYDDYQASIGNDVRLTQEMLREETIALDPQGVGVAQATISHYVNGYRTRLDLKVAALLLSFFRQIFPDVTLNDLVRESYEEVI